MRRRHTWIVVCCAIAFAAAVSSAPATPRDDDEAATKAFFKGDYLTAFKIWRKMAERGDAEKQRFLGSMYGLGQGVPQSDKESVKWYRKAAIQGDWLAQGALGSAYEYGYGVPQDYVRAYMWFNLSVAHGLPEGYTEAFSSRKDRDEVAALLTPSELERAQDMSTRCQESDYKECD